MRASNTIKNGLTDHWTCRGKVFEFKNVKNIIRLYSIEVIMPLERFMRRKRRLMTG